MDNKVDALAEDLEQLKRNQCDTAVQIVENYTLPISLADQINDCNAQISIEV